MRHGMRSFRKLGWVFIAIMICLAASSSSSRGDTTPAQGLHIPVLIPGLTGEIRSLRFYEAPRYGSVEFQKRKYQKSFPDANSRLINWELILDHPISREKTERFIITAVLHGPGGNVLSKSEALAWIEPGMQWSQWGNTFSFTHWQPGTYQVAIDIMGKQYVKKSFQIGGEKGAGPETGDVLQRIGASRAALQFFADGRNSPPVLGQRVFQKTFARAVTKYIWWELELDMERRTSKSIALPLDEIWYDPVGKVIGHFHKDDVIQAGWKKPTFWAGFGYEEPGKWAPGTYLVMLKNHDRVLKTGTFRVVPGPEILETYGGRVQSVRFFEGPKDASTLPRIKFSHTFDRNKVEFIYTELLLKFNHKRRRPLHFDITTLYLDEYDRLFKQVNTSHTIQPDWTEASLSSGYGWETPGHWPPGVYHVILKIQDCIVGTGSFRIR